MSKRDSSAHRVLALQIFAFFTILFSILRRLEYEKEQVVVPFHILAVNFQQTLSKKVQL